MSEKKCRNCGGEECGSCENHSKFIPFNAIEKESIDGSSADYYKLLNGATQLQDLISDKDMNAQVGEIFRACYRYGQVAHSPKLRDIKKIIFYAEAEKARLEKLEKTGTHADSCGTK